jgi:2-methylcitrate dehydratase PrpD
MSIGYGVARMLAEGSVDARHFTDESIADAATVDLAQRVEVIGDPAVDALGPDRRYRATVTVLTTDGRELRREIEDRPGNSSNPMSADQLRAKFTSLAVPVIGAGPAAAVIEAVATVEDMTGIGQLVGLLTLVEPSAVDAEARA